METLVLSVGGSIIAPNKPDYFFLKEFKNFVIKNLDKYRFIIVTGGGKTNSYYNEAAKRVSKVSDEDLDWLGITATRLNAELLRVIFGNLAYKKVIHDPSKKISTKKKIIIASGWKPGRSTDFVAVYLGKKLGAEKILNLTNIEYVYDKDPKNNKDAQKIFKSTWKKYRKIVGNKWSPRMNSPFDPVASKEAQKNKMTVVILKGTDIKNIQKYLEQRNFKGTIISPK